MKKESRKDDLYRYIRTHLLLYVTCEITEIWAEKTWESDALSRWVAGSCV